MRSPIYLKNALFLIAFTGFYFSAFPEAGLTLGGKFVPKDSMMVFICVGNSAMSGRDQTPDRTTNPHLWKYEMSPAKYDWLLAEEPICVDDPNNTLSSPKGGPIMPFLKRLAVLYPNHYFGIMQLSHSGWTLQGHFNQGSAEITSLITKANLLKPNVTIAAFVSMLNLVEVQNNDTANYLQKVTAMVANVRTQLGLPDLPYIHAGYPLDAKSSEAAKYDTSLASAKSIMRQISQIPGSIQNSAIIPTNGLSICINCAPANYFSHYDNAGNKGWGSRTADTVFSRNWVSVASTVGKSPAQALSPKYDGMRKVMFEGMRSSVFNQTGKSFSVYSPNGKAVPAVSVKSQNLRPGIYIVKQDKK
jgi:hypothetical protein